MQVPHKVPWCSLSWRALGRLGAHPQPHSCFGGARNHSISAPFFFYLSCLCLPAQAPQHGVSAQAVPSIRPSPCSYFRERQEVFLVLPAPGRNSEPLSRSSAGARETAAALADISCIIKLNPSRGLGLGHQLSKEGKEWSQRARG